MILHDALLASTDNVARRIVPARKYGPPVIRADRPWEGGLVLLFGSVLHDPEEDCYKAWYHAGGGQVAYAVSRDGIAWDRFNIALGSGAPLRVGQDLRFYYSGRTYRHTPYRGPDFRPGQGAIGLATALGGRLCALEASFDGGTVVTQPLRLARSRLLLDANAAYGEIAVTLLAPDGAPVAGSRRQVSGVDAPAIELTFDGGGQAPVQVQLELHNAQVFALST